MSAYCGTLFTTLQADYTVAHCPFPVALVQILYAQLVLQWSEQSSADSLGPALLLAPKVMTQVVTASGQSSREDVALACMLLAKLDLLGNLRRKQERAEAHAMQVCLAEASIVCDMFWRP